DLGEASERFGKAAHVRGQNAEARHTGVDLEVDLVRLRAGELHFVGDGFELGGVVHDGGEIVTEQLTPRAAVVAAGDQDRHLDAGFTQLDAFFQQCDADAVRAGALERARD